MKKFFKVTGIIFSICIIGLAGFIGFRYYKIKTFKDTYDLQERIALKCNQFVSDGKSVGLAVAVIQGDKVYVSGFGYLDSNGGKPVDSNTVFEIGSLTKVFTAELTQVLVDKGVIKWGETIYDILPPVYKPDVNDNTTLLSLVTHTAGFPKTPRLLLDNVTNKCDPYKDMNPVDYASCVKNLTEKKKPDTSKFAYSNMGFSVLANCVAAKAGCSYDTLLQREIFSVLGMNHTTLQNTDSANFASGHDSKANETSHWHLPSFYAGCGAIRSSISDMLKFLQANLSDGALFKPFAETQKRVYRASMVNDAAKAWLIRKPFGPYSPEVVWHNGGTGGFRSFMGLIPDRKIGVVVLSNQSQSVDMLGFDLVTLALRVSMQ